MDKRTLWTLALAAPALALVAYAWYAQAPLWALVGLIPAAFGVGFLVGVERVYKAQTGAPVSDQDLTEILERVL